MCLKLIPMKYLISIIFLLTLTQQSESALVASLTPTSQWLGGGCFTLSLWNQGDDVINTWQILLNAEHSQQTITLSIDEAWGSVMSPDTNINDNVIIISNAPHNGNINKWERVIGIGFCVTYSPEVDGNEVNIITDTIINGGVTSPPTVATTTSEPVTSTVTVLDTTVQDTTVVDTTITLIDDTTNGEESSGSDTTFSPTSLPDDLWEGNVTTTVVSAWEGGICANIRVHNTASNSANQWKFEASFMYESESLEVTLSEVWGAQMLFDATPTDNNIRFDSPSNTFLFPGEVEVGSGFCVDYVPYIDGNLVTIIPKIFFSGEVPEDDTTEPPPTDSFIPELKYAVWIGEGHPKRTGAWEGGLCSTLRVYNPHEEYVATGVFVRVNLVHPNNSVSNVKIDEAWSIDIGFDDNQEDTQIYLNRTGVSISPFRWLEGPGFCLSYSPDIHPDELSYTINVTLSGTYWTTPPVQPYPPVTKGGINSVYLPHGYFKTYKDNFFIRSQVREMATLNVKHQYANLGMLDLNGVMPGNQYNQLARWVQQSRIADPTQMIIAQVNGYRYSHIFNKEIYYNIAYSCLLIMQTTGVDGIHFDFEPPRPDPETLELLEMVRQLIGEDAYISIAGSGAAFRWGADYVQKIGKYVDAVAPMLYDNSKAITTAAGYQAWVKEAIKTYNIIYKTPYLRKGIEVLPILPAYSANEWHDPAVENLKNSIKAIMETINEDGMRIKGIGIWWWYEMTAEDKETMRNDFINKFGY